MKQLLYSAKAREDLRGILLQIAEDKPAAAIRFVEQLERRARLLMTFPNAGEACPNLGNGVHVLIHRYYGIYYRIETDAVRVERVLAPGLDVTGDLFNGSRE